MKISLKEWVLFIVIAVLGLFLWYKFAYPKFTFVDLSISRKEAIKKAESYLGSLGVDPQQYRRAVVFGDDSWANRYLQKTLGERKAEEFIKEQNYELFSWKIRFFKQLQKEEYNIEISPKSGKVVRFSHLIEDVEAREEIGKEAARQKAEDFLRNTYGLNLAEYDFHEERAKRYDHRVDYTFSWEKKWVYVPWKSQEGGAKLLIGALISGNEVRRFYKSNLDIPEKFRRYIENQFALGRYISSMAFIFLLFLLMCSTFIVVKRRHTLNTRLSKKWFFGLAIFLAAINITYILNNIQIMLNGYPTSISLLSYMGTYSMEAAMGLAFLGVNFILPGIAGESLRSEVFRDKKHISFLGYIQTTFLGRSVAKAILLGYIVFFITLGLQAAIFYLGQKYLGVWSEWAKFTHLSSAYLPFLSALAIASTASLGEEVLFRLFGIGLFKKYLKNTTLAVVLSSLIWGFSHSGYAIFPVWFRGIEVSVIGIGLGFIFIRYGIIPVIIAHYLFDVFWGVAAYIFGYSPAHLYFSSLFILLAPLVFCTVVFLLNRQEKEKETRILLDRVQAYNLSILKTFMSVRKSQGASPKVVKEELISHNWDIDLVDLALEDVFKI